MAISRTASGNPVPVGAWWGQIGDLESEEAMSIVRLASVAATAGLAAAPVLAQSASCVRWDGQGWRRVCVEWATSTSNVPEIDAGAGLLALAAVAAVMLFVWERRRRHAG